ncbi:MAG TPA: serine hydrolase, partial [Vicinamibacterales bacterium]|nr:serine hydrolase [Vicinamibacterales bacterium]
MRVVILLVLAALAVSGFSPAGEPAFEQTLAAAKDLPRLHSLIVSRRGDVVLERYFNGTRATRPANVKSVSKSVVSTLVGIAIHRKHIPGVDAPIVTWFPELKTDREKTKQAITVEDLLTMRSGLESTSNRNYGAWVQSRNWVLHALRRPLISEPGTSMQYSTGNSHLLSAILTTATRASTWRFANDTLAKPLGFSFPQWPQDPQGIYFGGNDMLMTPRQMLAFGELYLNRGRAGGTQVVPESWVESSLVPRGRSPISGNEYGY